MTLNALAKALRLAPRPRLREARQRLSKAGRVFDKLREVWFRAADLQSSR